MIRFPEVFVVEKASLHHPPHILIVGASLAGCASAILLGRSGFRVTVIERRKDMSSFKRVCTHLIQNSCVPTLQRLGLLEPMLKAGALWTALQVWQRDGWTRMCPLETQDAHGPTRNLNLRREVLDPLIREMAISTPGVELRLGVSLDSLVFSGRRVVGANTSRENHKERIDATLVIGADGRHSQTAHLAHIRTVESPSIRGGWGAYYKNVDMGNPSDTHFWLLEPDIAYSFPTDHGLTLLATITTTENLAVWKSDIQRHHLNMLASLPDAPDISKAERVSDFFGLIKAPGFYRNPSHRLGLTLVGDAALTTDFVWGDGTGYALRSAALLADAISTPESCNTAFEFDRAVSAYSKRHYRNLYVEQKPNSRYSSRSKINWLQRQVFYASRHDQAIQQLAFEIQSGRRQSTIAKLNLLLKILLFQASDHRRHS